MQPWEEQVDKLYEADVVKMSSVSGELSKLACILEVTYDWTGMCVKDDLLKSVVYEIIF